MGFVAGIAPPAHHEPALITRLSKLGIGVFEGLDDAGGPSTSDAPDLGAAVASALREQRLLVIADAGPDRRRWRTDAAELLGPLADAGADRPVVAVLLPASSPPRPGPVAILSPAGAASAYEVLLGGAIAVAGGRRVEHLNGRGAAGSTAATRSTGIAATRAAAPGWRELAVARPERAMHELTTRPSIVVAAVPPGGVDAGAVIADHPDADVVLVVDLAHRRHGAEVAAQVAAMVELAVGLEAAASTSAAAAPRIVRAPEAASPAPRIRASDLVHVRLTDAAVELTNRTSFALGALVDLGSADDHRRVVARLRCDLAPGEQRVVATDDVVALDDLDAPTAVVLHGSHGDAEVFEGGTRRLLGVELELLDARGERLGRRAFEVGNGLDFAATARVLQDLVGGGAETGVLPEPVAPAASATARGDLLAALDSAVVAGAAVLARRSSA